MIDLENVILQKDAKINDFSNNKTSLSLDEVQKQIFELGTEIRIVRDKVQIYKNEISDANNCKHKLISGKSKVK